MAVLPSLRNLRAVLQSVVFVPFAYAFFYNMIPVFLAGWESADRLQERFQDNFRSRQNMFDYIVVGGGSAGSIVANRLSEFYSVLLLEAGGDANPLQLVPALTLNYLNYPQTDFQYKTVPLRLACLNSINQQGSLSAGRALGGSSNLDWMSFLRGHPVDFDMWARILGDRSWSYAQVLPFFRRSEEFIGSSTDRSARGGDGELRVRQPDFIAMAPEWTRAGEELGYQNVDLNGLYTEGFGVLQYPVRRGMRQSTARSFIRPIRMGARLRVLTHAFVNRILFRDMSNMAYGVEYERFGRTDLAIASREVIISAGTLSSPKILMLSGVGPRAHLEQMGIPVRSDLPVGRNLQDHLGVQLGPFYMNTTQSFLLDRDVTPESIVQWIVKGSGPLTTTGIQGVAAISSAAARARGEQNWPDIQLLLQGQGVHREYPQQFARAYNLMEDELVRYYENAVGRDSFHIRVIGARPTSTGTVLLSSSNPRDPMVINPRYLEDNGQGDLRILMEGIQTALRLVENTTSFRNIGAEFTRMKLPGCEPFDFRTMAYWECYIRRFTLSQHNPVGTNSMGSVVDADLKVRGTRGLRVVDASVMPTIVSVGTMASTMMIGEKAADAILRESGTSQRNQGVVNAIFGRNGLINRNPIQTFLSREFDRINPLPALFRTPRNESNNFNPFSRFLGVLGIGRAPGSGTGFGLIDGLFSQLNAQTTALFATLLGGGGRSAGIGSNFLTALFGTPRNRTVPQLPTNPANGTNLFDIIFPQRNSTITLPNPFQNIFGKNQNSGGNLLNQIFRIGNTTSGRAVTAGGGLGPVLGNNQNNNANANPLFNFLFGSTKNNTTPANQLGGLGNNQNNDNVGAGRNNNNIFGNLFAPKNNTLNPFGSLASLFGKNNTGGLLGNIQNPNQNQNNNLNGNNNPLFNLLFGGINNTNILPLSVGGGLGNNQNQNNNLNGNNNGLFNLLFGGINNTNTSPVNIGGALTNNRNTVSVDNRNIFDQLFRPRTSPGPQINQARNVGSISTTALPPATTTSSVTASPTINPSNSPAVILALTTASTPEVPLAITAGPPPLTTPEIAQVLTTFNPPPEVISTSEAPNPPTSSELPTQPATTVNPAVIFLTTLANLPATTFSNPGTTFGSVTTTTTSNNASSSSTSTTTKQTVALGSSESGTSNEISNELSNQISFLGASPHSAETGKRSYTVEEQQPHRNVYNNNRRRPQQGKKSKKFKQPVAVSYNNMHMSY